MRHLFICQLCAGLLGLVALTGCGSVEPGSTDGNHASADAHDHSHEHGEEGPHGGHLIELGRNHEYHAELVDEHGSVTIYILDAHMDEVAIDDSVITLNLRAGEQNASHELTTATPGGQSHSRFVSSEASLLSAFEAMLEFLANSASRSKAPRMSATLPITDTIMRGTLMAMVANTTTIMVMSRGTTTKPRIDTKLELENTEYLMTCCWISAQALTPQCAAAQSVDVPGVQVDDGAGRT